MTANQPSPIRRADQYENNAMFDWSDDLPRPTRSYINRDYNALQPATMSHLIAASMALPYRGTWDAEQQQYVIEDPMFVGATMGEVIAYKTVEAAANGGYKEREAALDRFMGKPKQQIEQSIKSMSYTEFLEESARQEQHAREQEEMIRSEVIDIQPTRSHTDDLDELLGDI